MKLGARFCRIFRTHHIFNEVQNTGCNDLRAELLLERDGKFLDHIQKIYKRGSTAQNNGHVVCKPAQPDPSSLADFPLVFSNNETSRDVLVNPAYVALSMQLSHCPWKMTSV